MIPVRAEGPLPAVIRIFGPVSADHPMSEAYCAACDDGLAGRPIALVYIGPGDNPEDQEKARTGRWHTGAAVAVHAECAGEQP